MGSADAAAEEELGRRVTYSALWRQVEKRFGVVRSSGLEFGTLIFGRVRHAQDAHWRIYARNRRVVESTWDRWPRINRRSH